MYKKCTKCKKQKLLKDFPFRAKEEKIYKAACKECASVERRKYREKNLEKEKSQVKAWKEENKERVKEYSKEYYKNNVSTFKEYREDAKKKGIGGKEYLEYYRQNNKKNRKKKPKKLLLSHAKKRAKIKKMNFSLKEEDFEIPELCPILKIPLFHGVEHQIDNSPTLDRINNDKGYIKENIIVISNKANRMKNNGSFKEIEMLYLWCKENMEIQK
jgi:hypothetical protein